VMSWVAMAMCGAAPMCGEHGNKRVQPGLMPGLLLWRCWRCVSGVALAGVA
jgi:hypothetical protein